MSVQPIRNFRISTSQQTQILLEQLRTNSLRLFQFQQQMATGLRMLVPSDDPPSASRSLKLSDMLERYRQWQRNGDFAARFASATESALADIRDILNEATVLASRNVGVLADPDQRTAAATLVEGMIDQLVSIANRQHEGMYLFAGRAVDQPPFEQALGGVIFRGDTEPLLVNVDGNNQLAVNLTSEAVFGALSGEVQGWADLDPAATDSMRLADLNGANGVGIRLGSIVIDEVGGAGPFVVDLSQAETLGDVVEAINAASAAAGATVTAAVIGRGLELSAAAAMQITVTEQGNGKTASDLGILQPTPVNVPFAGAPLEPRLTSTTPLTALRGGAGVDLTSGLVLQNGGQTVFVDLSGAQTLQDVLNAINATDIGVTARINEAGTGIDVISTLSGGSLKIGENGGTTATDLGIRSFHAGTLLSSLNEGNGVGTVSGNDLRIVAKDGSEFEVDLSGATTVQDVLDAINTAAASAGVAVTASLAVLGNGIRLTDGTGGGGPLCVEAVNFSPAAADLGLNKQTSGAELVSDDVHEIRPDGLFSTLARLREGLLSNDASVITKAGERLSELLQELGRWQGHVGALSRSIESHRRQMDDAVLAAEMLLSEAKDADLTEIVTRFGQAQTLFQANLMTGARLMNMSLLDFLR